VRYVCPAACGQSPDTWSELRKQLLEGEAYRLAGASWFGGNLDFANGKYEFSDTEFFNILGPDGVVARVAGVEPAGSGGSNFSFSFGACQAPQD
jgi:hypothetical protein